MTNLTGRAWPAQFGGRKRVTSAALTEDGLRLLHEYRGGWSIGDAIEWLALWGTTADIPDARGHRSTRYPGKRWRHPTSVKLSDGAIDALKQRAAGAGISRNDLIEVLIRESGPALRAAAEAAHT
jgi:Ribbon-helix-helix protein, copG family